MSTFYITCGTCGEPFTAHPSGYYHDCPQQSWVGVEKPASPLRRIK